MEGLHQTALLGLVLLVCPGQIAAACGVSLRVSPDRSQFFEYKSVSLSCEEQQGSSTGWRVRRNTTSGKLSDCGAGWGKPLGSFCNITNALPPDNGVYWCESVSGQHSNTVNITVTNGSVILEIPGLPVTDGEAVTLCCRYKTTPSNLTADFYKNGSLIKTESAGEMTIPAVSKCDEGLYKCHNSDLGESPESWLAVRDDLPCSTPTVSPHHLVTGLSVALVISLVVVVVIVLVMLCFCRKQKGNPSPESDRPPMTTGPGGLTYGQINIQPMTKPKKKRDKPAPPEHPVIYSSVRPGHSAGPCDVTYGQINIQPNTKPKKKRDEPAPPEHDVVYSSVRPGHYAVP